MKKITAAIITLSSFFIISCNNGGNGSGNNNDSADSKKVASDSNKEKFTDSTIHDDTKFAVAAADGGMLEVKLGNLALTKSNSQEVKNFAQMMVNDHGKANDEFKALAAQKNITIPATLSTESQRKVTELSQKTGADFDKDYTASMIDDHKEDISLFKKEVSNGKDTAIRSWAAGKISTLEHHLQMAHSTNALVKNKK